MANKVGFKEIVIAIVVVFVGIYIASPSSGNKDENFKFTDEGIKKLDSDISSVNLIKQVMSDNPESYAVEIEIRRDPFSADNEWNYISQTYIHRIGAKLLEEQQVSRLRIVFISPSDGNRQWAQVKISKKDFPNNWKDFSYHQFFSRTDPDPTTFQTKSWLCKYYQKYESSRPNGAMPAWCDRFMDGRFD